MRMTRAFGALLAACAATSACGQPYMPMRTAVVDTHAPPDIDYAHEKLVTDDGVELYAQRWAPSGQTRAIVVVVHGFKDHGSRYRDLGVSFAEHGLAVDTFDMRGHGYSAGVRDHVVSLDRALADLDRIVARVRLRAPDRPLFLLGQGFGATLAGLYTVRSHPKLTGLVLSAPALRGHVEAAERAGAAMAATFAPRAGKLAMDFSQWSTDKAAVEALRSDPLVAEGEVTAGSVRALLHASDELQKRIGEITVPLLILDGDKDVVSDHQAIVALGAAAHTPDKTVTVYPGLEYDLFHESQRDQVISETIEWLRTHAAAAAPPPPAPPAPEPAPAPAKKKHKR
jgi:acylglycerol lipase